MRSNFMDRFNKLKHSKRSIEKIFTIFGEDFVEIKRIKQTREFFSRIKEALATDEIVLKVEKNTEHELEVEYLFFVNK